MSAPSCPLWITTADMIRQWRPSCRMMSHVGRWCRPVCLGLITSLNQRRVSQGARLRIWVHQSAVHTPLIEIERDKRRRGAVTSRRAAVRMRTGNLARSKVAEINSAFHDKSAPIPAESVQMDHNGVEWDDVIRRFLDQGISDYRAAAGLCTIMPNR